MTEPGPEKAAARGGCPRCGKTVPFLKAGFRRGRGFPCPDCGARLTTSRGPASGAIALFCLASAAARIMPPALIIAILAIGVVIEWLTAKVYLLPEAEQAPADRPSTS
jgi:hypothetical protein